MIIISVDLLNDMLTALGTIGSSYLLVNAVALGFDYIIRTLYPRV